MNGRVTTIVFFVSQAIVFDQLIQACPSKLDLVVIIDGSRSTSSRQYNNLLELSWNIIEILDTNDSSIEIGVIIYGDEVVKPIPLTDNLAILSNLKQFSQPGGQSKPFMGLLNARGLFRSRRRKDAAQIALFMAGSLAMFERQTSEQTKIAREEGIVVMPIYFGSGIIHGKQWQNLSVDTDNILHYEDVSSILQYVNSTAEKICSVAAVPLLPTSSIQENAVASYGPCMGFTMSQNIGYKRHESDCTKLLQCDPNKYCTSTISAKICPFGEFWDQKSLACRPAELVDCPQDYCKLRLLSVFATLKSCGSFYECQNGRSVVKCCPPGHAFFPGAGCKLDRTCRAPCPFTEIPGTDWCQSRPVYGQTRTYRHFMKPGYWVEKICDKGNIFDESTCSCAKRPSLSSSTDFDCRPKVYLPFCEGTKDHSGHNTNVINEADQVRFRNGKAYFNGRGKLSIPVFSNKDLGGTIIIKLKYKIKREKELEEYEETSDMDDIESMYDNDDYDDDKLMTLWSNGYCYKRGPCQEEPSIVMATNKVLSVVKVTTVQNVSTILNLDKITSEFDYEFDMEDEEELEEDMEEHFDEEYDFHHQDFQRCKNDTWDSEWRTALFLLNKNTLSLYDDDVNGQKPIDGSGDVKKTYYGLHFGQGYGLGGFRGYMDEIHVYLCRPNDDILFDGVKVNKKELQEPSYQQSEISDTTDTTQITTSTSKHQLQHTSSEPDQTPSYIQLSTTKSAVFIKVNNSVEVSSNETTFDQDSFNNKSIDSTSEKDNRSETTTASFQSYDDFSGVSNFQTTSVNDHKTVLGTLIRPLASNQTTTLLEAVLTSSSTATTTIPHQVDTSTSFQKNLINLTEKSITGTKSFDISDDKMKLLGNFQKDLITTNFSDNSISSLEFQSNKGSTTTLTENYTHSDEDSEIISLNDRNIPISTNTEDTTLDTTTVNIPVTSLNTHAVVTKQEVATFGDASTPVGGQLSTTTNKDIISSTDKISINVIRAKIYFRLKPSQELDNEGEYYYDYGTDDYDDSEYYDYGEDNDEKFTEYDRMSMEQGEIYDHVPTKAGTPDIKFQHLNPKDKMTLYNSTVNDRIMQPLHNNTISNPSQFSSSITDHALSSAGILKYDNIGITQAHLGIGKETLKLNSSIKDKTAETAGVKRTRVNIPISNLDQNKLHQAGNSDTNKKGERERIHGANFNNDDERRKAIDVKVDSSYYAKTTRSIDFLTYEDKYASHDLDHTSRNEIKQDNPGIEEATLNTNTATDTTTEEYEDGV